MSGSDDADSGLATFLVEQYWPGVTPAVLAEASEQVQRRAEQVAREGALAVRFLHSTLVPEEEAAFCVVEAESATAVEAAYERAGVSFQRIVDAVQMNRLTSP